MSKKDKKRTEPWGIAAGTIAIIYIVYMWSKKDIVGIYSTMPKKQLVPLIATTIGVSLIKVIAIAGAIALIKWIIAKLKDKDTRN